MVTKKVRYYMAYKEVLEAAKQRKGVFDYSFGETRIPVDIKNNKWRVKCLWVSLGQFEFQFRGKSKNGSLSGFEYILSE